MFKVKYNLCPKSIQDIFKISENRNWIYQKSEQSIIAKKHSDIEDQ